jgi:broad-specificity NMP kinase
MNTPRIVFLYGPPGVGKFTIGSCLRDITGIGMVHNHATVDIGIAVFGRDEALRRDLMIKLRHEIAMGATVKRRSLITTVAYSGEVDNEWLADMHNGVTSAGGTMSFVRLTAPREVLMERIAHSPHRFDMGKIVDPSDLADRFDRCDVEAIVPYASITVDTTQQPPRASALLIANSLRLALL